MNRNKKDYFFIDLFAGCGGLSEGFIQTGFRPVAQVEMDKWACETLRTRHLYYELSEMRKGYIYRKFLKGEISKNEILNKFPVIQKLISNVVIPAEFGKDSFRKIIKKIEAAKKFQKASRINAVIGGPPCQPYSLVGRARDPYRMRNDNRHFLYEYYLKILKSIQPDFFVFENVPGLITANTKGHQIFSHMLEDFKKINPPYEIAPSFDEYYKEPRQYLLDSSKYGIPQRRKRVIFIGYKKPLISKNPDIKNIFRKIIKTKVPSYGGYTVSDAIGDLPSLKPGHGKDQWFGQYRRSAITPYQHKMRHGSPGIVNHRARTHMKDDLKRYKFFIEQHLNGDKAATLIDLMKEKPDLTPAHNHLDKFIDRFKVQWWSHPASTIMAHIAKDGHYYIHPDLHQCRSFTVREAARCQSFPDNFKLEGPRTEQFKQVGNAVPPILAKIIATNIIKELNKIHES